MALSTYPHKNKPNKMPKIHRVDNVDHLTPERYMFPALVFVDIENILTKYKGVSVDRLGKDLIVRLKQAGSTVVLASNMDEPDRMGEIASQVHVDAYVHKGMPTITLGQVLHSKSHPDMFDYGAKMVGFDSAQGAGLIDDQLKNVAGARMAGIGQFYWLKPRYPQSQHTGVKLSRALEVPIGTGYRVAQTVGRGISSALRGTHG